MNDVTKKLMTSVLVLAPSCAGKSHAIRHRRHLNVDDTHVSVVDGDEIVATTCGWPHLTNNDDHAAQPPRWWESGFQPLYHTVHWAILQENMLRWPKVVAFNGWVGELPATITLIGVVPAMSTLRRNMASRALLEPWRRWPTTERQLAENASAVHTEVLKRGAALFTRFDVAWQWIIAHYADELAHPADAIETIINAPAGHAVDMGVPAEAAREGDEPPYGG